MPANPTNPAQPADPYKDWKDPYADQWNPSGGPMRTARAAPGGQNTGNDANVAGANAAYNQGQRGSDPNQIYGQGGAQAYRDWYNQQQGGNRSEDLARFSDETLAGWDQYAVKDGQQAGKYRSMRGAEGYFDKPTECPPGQVPSGPNETDPCRPMTAGEGGGGNGGSGGSGGSGGAGGGGLNQWNNPIYQMLAERGKAGLADPSKALENYMGQGGAAKYGESMDAARARIAAMPPGRARDFALASLEQGKASSGTQMQLDANNMAYQNAMGLTGLEQGYTQQDLSKYQGDQSNATSRYGIDQSTGLGYANLGEGARQFDSGQNYNKWAQQGNWGQNSLDRASQEKMAQNQINSQKKSTLEKIMGGIGSVAGVAGMFMSDIQMKENIEPGGRGLASLKALPSYTYNYRGDSEPRQGIMAQDLEKVAPELVHEYGGIKHVDGYGLLSMTMNAVKELDAKLAKRRKK